MGSNSKIIIIVVSIAIILQCSEAAVRTKLQPNPVFGCPALNPQIRCIWYNEQCNDESDPCSGIEICCPNECGTSCTVPSYYEPSPIEGCPPINTMMNCFQYYEQCNSADKQCPAGSICCGDNCGTSCRDPNGEYVPNDVASV